MKQSKFGIPYRRACLVCARRGLEHIRIEGIDCHIGSQLTELDPIAEALGRVADLVERLETDGIALKHVDVGGGIGIRYGSEETPPDLEDYARAVTTVFPDRRVKLLFEPGRMLTGNAGLLLTRIEYLKKGADRNFAIIDAAMNDLVSPALYDAWHEVRPVRRGEATDRYDLVGPVWKRETFGEGSPLPAREGELLAIMSAGAYGMSMASNYNSRPRAAEVMIDGESVHLVRERETVGDLFAGERRLPATE